ncbi:hypothetical protein BT93_A2139 [Corymbia citriodora subsp. variegata]|nr:hypothetical protein BT93_A2139 [Corymbia citriodora subsp. variegata]
MISDLELARLKLRVEGSIRMGIQSVAVDMDNRKVTVIGSMDPVQLAEHLRKRFDTVIEYVGPKETPTTQVTGTGESNDNTPNPDSEGKTYVYYPYYPTYPPPYCHPPPCYHFHY